MHLPLPPSWKAFLAVSLGTADHRPKPEPPHSCVLPRFTYRRVALLPFALLVERLAPVPFGILNLNGCCHLSIELSGAPVSSSAGSAATSQSPELGDLQ